MISLLIVLLICLFLSAYFSGSEMAYISANKIQIRDKAEEGDAQAKIVVGLHDKPESFLTTILIGNNVVNVASTAILTYILEVNFHIRSEWVVALIMTPLLLVAGEMVPKDYCRIKGDHVLLQQAHALNFTLKVLYFPATWMMGIIRWILSPFGGQEAKSIFVSERELRSIIEESAQAGVVESHEKQIIDTILDFEHMKTNAVMTPLDKVVKIDIHSNVGDIKKLAKRTHARMVLVYEEDPQIVVGMIYVFDLLFEDNDRLSLKNFLRSPIFLQGNASIETSFLTLQQHRQSYAVVTNEIGETIGAVPIERLLVHK